LRIDSASQPLLALRFRATIRHAYAAVFLLVLFASWGRAGAPSEPPLRGRPENFSGLVGLYTIAVTATPHEVCVEDPILLTVQIEGRGPTEPERRKLRLFPSEIADNFYVENVPEEDTKTEKSWSFVYRLRPKNIEVELIPSLELVYYLPERRKYQTAVSSAIAIKVKPRPEAKLSSAVSPIRAPDYFFELVTGPEVLENWEPGPLSQAWVIALLLLVPPAGCGIWYWYWRRLHPDGACQSRRRRSGAAEAALRLLRSGELRDANQLRAAVVVYLHERAELRHVEPTPAEVNQHLGRLGASRKAAQAFASFFQACDADRFAPSLSARTSSVDQAIQLILAWEAEPCSKRAC
jgi:hypothetical protein